MSSLIRKAPRILQIDFSEARGTSPVHQHNPKRYFKSRFPEYTKGNHEQKQRQSTGCQKILLIRNLKGNHVDIIIKRNKLKGKRRKEGINSR